MSVVAGSARFSNNGYKSIPAEEAEEAEEKVMTYRGIVRQGIVQLEEGIVLPDGTEVNVEPLTRDDRPSAKRPGTSLADWAEQNAEDWRNQFSSADVESFTGRRF